MTDISPVRQGARTHGAAPPHPCFEPERHRARAIDWDQSDRGLSSGRAAQVLQSRRRLHGCNRHHASFSRNALAPREPSIHGSSPMATANAIRSPAMSRRNALFAGHDKGGRNWARFASLQPDRYMQDERRRTLCLSARTDHEAGPRPSCPRHRRPYAMSLRSAGQGCIRTSSRGP